MGDGYSLAAHAAIRDAIDHNGGKISDIAAASGMSADYLYRRLRNELPFTVTDIERICDTLGIDPYALLQKPAEQDHGDDNAELVEQLRQLTNTVADLKATMTEHAAALTPEQREQIARERIRHGITLAANKDPHLRDEIDHAGERA